MTYDELAGSVKLSEGFRDHVYVDTEGFRTIGWGHKVVHEDNFVIRKSGIEQISPQAPNTILEI